MGRKPARVLMHAVVVVTTWVAGATLAHGLGADLGRDVRELEERIEMRLRGSGAPAERVAPEHSPEDQSIEPWELVNV